MGKSLVLAEKPSVARELAKVLGCGNGRGGNGSIEGGRYIVTWALGHLVTLADPEVYDQKYAKWNLEDLPMLPPKMQLVVIKETAKQYNTVQQLMRRTDVDELIIATDAGREGELVARWIMEKVNFRKPVKRLWISSQTEKAIKEGFAHLKPGADYVNLYKSAQSRAEADWLVGLNVTRGLTCKHNAQLSAGRVQTPTLAMVVAREDEIRQFTATEYWTLAAQLAGFDSQWRDKTGQMRFSDKGKAESLVTALKGKSAKVIRLEKNAKLDLPPLAYDLTSLQMDANRKYGISAKETSNAMQQLYERHKLVTYPRTDSKHISRDIVPSLVERVKCVSIGPWQTAAVLVLRTGIQTTRRFVDDAKVTDHHAIIPTDQYVDLSGLDQNERKIYDLIVKRFLAVLSPASEYEQTKLTLDIGGETFVTSGRVMKTAGWRAISDELDDDEDSDEAEGKESGNRGQTLPVLKQGETLIVNSIRMITGKTKPPARYNEATLLAAMEHPGKMVSNARLRETLDNTSGLGTPATRADILEKLFNSFYMERRGREILPTSKGRQLVDLVPEDLKSPELTAKWEQQLQKIGRGQADAAAFSKEIRTYAAGMVSKVIANDSVYKHDNMTREKCPECGKFMLDVTGKRGKMLVCPDRECGYRKNVSQTSNARCPECHKKMEMRGDGDNKTFYCSCGHREKLETFKERAGERVNKREVSKFLQQQNQPEEINSALADALAKWRK